MQILRSGLLILLGLAVAMVVWMVGYRIATRTDLTPLRVEIELVDGRRVELGHAVLRPNLPSNPTVELYFAIPMERETGKARSTASTIVFSAPFLNEDRFLKRDGLRDEYLRFVRLDGWSFFTLAIKGDLGVSADGRQNYYVYPESGWPEVVFAVKAWLESRYGLSSRPLVLIGESSGGSMAEQLAVSYPEKVCAAAWNGGSTYAEIPAESPVAFFAFNSWGCPGAYASRDLSRRSAGEGVQVLWEEGPPIWEPFDGTHHGCSSLASALRRRFLEDVMAMADERGRVPPACEWPVAFTQPDGRVLHFPSEEFRKLWEEIPLELNAAVRGELSARSVLVNPSGGAAGRAVVLFPGELDSVKLRDLTHALNLGNCAVLADWQNGQGTSLPEIPPEVPVQLWGFDDDGCKAVEALAALRKTGRAVEKCVLFAPEWLLDDALKTTLADAAQAGTKIVAAFPGQGFFEEEIPGVEIVAIPEADFDEAAWLERLQQLAQ